MISKIPPVKTRLAPQTASRETRRKQPVMAASDSISKRGFSETTLRHVTEKADLSNGAINDHLTARKRSKVRFSGIYVAPAADVSHWHHNTMEQGYIQTRVMEMGRGIVALVPVAMRNPQLELYTAPRGTIDSLKCISDCHMPGTIAAAVYAGHRYAREPGGPPLEGAPFRRELPILAAD